MLPMGNINSLNVLKRAVESATTGVVIADTKQADMPLTYVNPAFETITGYSREFTVGRNCRFLQGPETDQKQVEKIRTAIKEGVPCKVILLNYKRDGTKFWNELSISPIEEDGEVIGFIGIQDDITTRVEMEQALFKAKKDAEDADRLKVEFLNVISHELRTPLTVMLGNLPLLTDPEDMPDVQEIVEIATDIEDSGIHLLKLINELLDISRIEEGRLELNLEPLSIGNCIQEALHLIMPMIDKKGLKLTQEIQDFSFMGDPIRIKQIFINLIGNAVKFTKEGTITIISEMIGNQGKITVRDTGCGIKKENYKQIFEVFKQVDGSSARAASGSGLGLAISRKLIEMQKGTINVKSEYGLGSDFYVIVPLLEV